MPVSFDLIFKLVLACFVLIIGLIALVGGLKRKPKPFFWTSNNSTYLKTSSHYIIFGTISIAIALFFIVRVLRLLDVF